VLEARTYPTVGLTYNEFRDEPLATLKQALILAAGPLANYALLWVAIHALEPVWRAERFESGLAPVSAFIGANFALLVINLAPWHRGHVSDGMQLLRLLYKRPDYAFLSKIMTSVRAADLIHLKQLEAAERAVSQGLDRYPNDYILSVAQSAVLSRQQRYDEARALLKSLLQREPPKLIPGIEAVVSNNLAWTDFMAERDDLAHEILSLASKAYAAFPWVQEIQVTYACTQAGLGDIDLAMPVLNKLAASRNAPDAVSAAHCFLAVVSCRQGKLAEADASLAKIDLRDEARAQVAKRAKQLIAKWSDQPTH
jgi:tetratricopeptide (TPR) repeat protein